MNKFDKKMEELMNEGILQRTKQKFKNIGRTIKHPYKKMFGNDEDSYTASMSSGKGYKRVHMLADVMKDTATDLIKLNVLSGKYSPEEVAHFLSQTLLQSEYFNQEGALSKQGEMLGKREEDIRNREKNLDYYEGRRAAAARRNNY